MYTIFHADERPHISREYIGCFGVREPLLRNMCFLFILSFIHIHIYTYNTHGLSKYLVEFSSTVRCLIASARIVCNGDVGCKREHPWRLLWEHKIVYILHIFDLYWHFTYIIHSQILWWNMFAFYSRCSFLTKKKNFVSKHWTIYGIWNM